MASTEYTLVLTAAGDDQGSAPVRAEGVLLLETSGEGGEWRLDFPSLGVGTPSEGRFLTTWSFDRQFVVALHPDVIDDDVVMYFPDGIADQGVSRGKWEYRTDAGVEAHGDAELHPPTDNE